MTELMDDSRTIDVTLSTPRHSSCNAPDGIGYGDIDGDGFVTSADADYLANHIAGIAGYPLSAAQAIRADVNGDGKVDARDVAWIAKFANHVSGYDVFPVCAVDKCATITCKNTCDGTSLWSQECVNGLCVKKALIETNSPTCGYVAPTPSQGQLEELDYPTSVNHGDDMMVAFKIHNTGGSTGTFIARLYQGSAYVGNEYEVDDLHAGYSHNGAITVKAPISGTSVSYTLKLFKET